MYKTMQINGHDVEVEYTIDTGQPLIKNPVDQSQEGIEPSAEIQVVWITYDGVCADILPYLSSEQIERLEQIALEAQDDQT
jgi:hypothetical protein